jgi:hypothetical protein
MTTPRFVDFGWAVGDLPWILQRLLAVHPYFIVGEHATTGGRHFLDILIIVPGFGFWALLWRFKGKFMESTVSNRALVSYAVVIAVLAKSLAVEAAIPWYALNTKINWGLFHNGPVDD